MAILALSYSIRVLWKGRVRFERIEQQEGVIFISKTLMEMGYWAIQPVARFLIRLGISANFVSWASLSLGAVAGVLLVTGRFASAGLVAALAGIFDAIDGLIARMTDTASKPGKVLDSSLDRYVEFFFLGGLLLYYRPDLWLQFLVLAAMIGSFMVSYSTAIAEIFRVPLRPGSMRRAERMIYLIAGAVLSPLTISSFEAEAGRAVGQPMVFALVLVAVGANFSAISRIRHIRTLLRQQEEDRRINLHSALHSVGRQERESNRSVL